MQVVQDYLWATHTTFEYTAMVMLNVTDGVFFNSAKYMLASGTHGVFAGGEPFMAQNWVLGHPGYATQGPAK
jgi:hypothetical protein